MAADDALWAARMRALAAFAPGYFHDLKGPLNTIVLRLELLRVAPAGEAAEDKRRASVAAIEEQVRRLDRLLQTWLTHTAPVASPPVCELRGLVQDATALAAPAARKARVELTVVIPDAVVPVRAAANPLAIAVLDLLRHALQSYAEGGALTLELTTSGATARLSLRGGAFDAAATALASRIVDGVGGACALVNDALGTAVVLTFPIADGV
jgi:signal transduction histidine kinase